MIDEKEHYSSRLIVGEVKDFNGILNISAYRSTGKDKNGEWNPALWWNIRPTQANQDFAMTLKKGDRIRVEGFFKTYKTKKEPIQTKQYLVCQVLEMAYQSNNPQPQTPAHGYEAPNDDDCPF
jgi:single-stranded DNA-binding protein